MKIREANLSLTLAVAAIAALVLPGVAKAHNGSPNYRSTLRQITRAQPGLQVQVLNYDDRLQLINRSGETVIVRGYGNEPYIRILSDGRVEVNKRSPSFYLNQDRYANVDVPPAAKTDAHPSWKLVDQTGRYEWHDHRIHYMAKGVPPQVKDRNKRTEIFGWKVPIDVGGKHAMLRGELAWQPQTGGLPRAAMLAFAGLVFGGVSFVEIVRRRRRRRDSRRQKRSEAWG